MSSKVFILVAIVTGCMVATCFSEEVSIQLKNGTEVAGTLIKKTEQNYYLDLGFTVLVIPSDQVVMSIATGLEIKTDSAPTTQPGSEQTPTPEPTAEPKPEAEPLAVENLTTAPVSVARRALTTFDELETAVAIVSNPGGFGAGFIIDPQGLILTNWHVVRGEKYNDATVFLRVNDKLERKKFEQVEMIAFSQLLDIALLKIKSDDLKDIALPSLALANIENLQVGDKVYAIGNPGVGSSILDHTISEGIVSSKNRNFNDLLYLQTTAAVNPGNSGGPLLNSRGEVIGLVTFKAFFQDNIAFALPSNYIRLFLENLKAYSPTEDSEHTGYRYLKPPKP